MALSVQDILTSGGYTGGANPLSSYATPTDPYAALRSIAATQYERDPWYGVTGYTGDNEVYGYLPQGPGYNIDWGSLGGFQGSKNEYFSNPDSDLVRLNFSDPGGGNYDAFAGNYRYNPETQRLELVGDISQERWDGGVRSTQNFLKTAGAIAGLVGGAYYLAPEAFGAAGAGEVAGAGAAATGAGTAAEVGAGLSFTDPFILDPLVSGAGMEIGGGALAGLGEGAAVGSLGGAAASVIPELTYTDPFVLDPAVSGSGAELTGGPLAGVPPGVDPSLINTVPLPGSPGTPGIPGTPGTPGSGTPGTPGGGTPGGTTLEDILQKIGGSIGSGSFADWASLLTSLYGLKVAGDAKEEMDPFASERGRYAEMLRSLEANPQSITSMPGYQAGIGAVNRLAAASGYYGSGNMASGLMKYGGDFYTRERDRLAQLAGANVQPGAGYPTYIDLLGRSFTGVGNAINQWGP